MRPDNVGGNSRGCGDGVADESRSCDLPTSCFKDFGVDFDFGDHNFNGCKLKIVIYSR